MRLVVALVVVALGCVANAMNALAAVQRSVVSVNSVLHKALANTWSAGASTNCHLHGIACSLAAASIFSDMFATATVDVVPTTTEGQHHHDHHGSKTRIPEYELVLTETTDGATVVETAIVKTTVVATVTMGTPKQSPTPFPMAITLTDPINPNATVVSNGTATSCANNASIDTQSYLNISTFKATGLTYTPFLSVSASAESSMAAARSSKVSAVSTTTKATETDIVGGFTGAVTSTIGSSTSGKVAELGGLNIPALVFAVMAACFGLALLL